MGLDWLILVFMVGAVLGAGLVYLFGGSAKEREDRAAAARAQAEAEAADAKTRQMGQERMKAETIKQDGARARRYAQEDAEREERNRRRRQAREDKIQNRSARVRAEEEAERRRERELPILRREARAKTDASREVNAERLTRDGQITTFQVAPIPDGSTGRHITVEWKGPPGTKVSVAKLVGEPLVGDIDVLRQKATGQKLLVDGLNKMPVTCFDPKETVGVQTAYYAWLEADFSYSEYKVDANKLELVAFENSDTEDWGLELRELLLRAETPPPAAAEENLPKNIPGLETDEFVQELLIAIAPIVGAKQREEKLQQVVNTFVAEHGLEDEAGDVANLAYQVLEDYNARANKKGRS